MDDRRIAFEALFAEQHSAVLRYVQRRVDDREQARELTMDCFEIAWKKFDQNAPFRRPWLLKTARNLIGDSYRKRDRERDGFRDLVSASTAPDAAFDNVELHVALRQLPAAERELLELFYWDGLSATEIAEVVGCRTSAAWKRLSRAREALRTLLEAPQAPTSATPAGKSHSGVVSPSAGGVLSYVME